MPVANQSESTFGPYTELSMNADQSSITTDRLFRWSPSRTLPETCHTPPPHNHPAADFKQIFLTHPPSTLVQTPASRRRPAPLARSLALVRRTVRKLKCHMPCEPDTTILSSWKYALQLQRILRIYEYDKVTIPPLPSSATPFPAPVCSSLQLPRCQAPSPYPL